MLLPGLQSFIFHKLHSELPSWLMYHNAAHTEKVAEHAAALALSEGVAGDPLTLLLTAATLHDAGFLTTHINHEAASCELAKEYLPQYGYTTSQVDYICRLIMTTKLPQSPFDKASEILCDADLYYLGTDNFKLYASRLFREMKHHKPDMTNEEWTEHQKKFLADHTYFTPSAKQELDRKKKQNIKELYQNHQKSITPHKDFKISDVLFMMAGVITAGFALKGFLVPNNFFDGGVTGISLLVHELYHVNLAFVIVIANIPLIIMSMYSVNKTFALKTSICVILLGLCLFCFPYPVITSDKLLVSVFGGFFLGMGIGFTMRGGCALDGIEVLALYTWRRTSFSISEIVLLLNTVIFCIAAIKFGIETSLYSMLTYFTASKTIDYVIEGVEAYTGVTIISEHSERIKERLVNEMGRGITIYKGERGYLPGKYEVHADVDIIFTVITRLELRKLKNVVYAEDYKAFVFASTIKETSGGILKRRHSH